MRDWDAARIAAAADGAQLVRSSARAPRGRGPERATIDSRTAAAGELFVGLRGERTDGGVHAADALAAGAWGVLVRPEHATGAIEAVPDGVVLSHPDPLEALQALASAWRGELQGKGTLIVAITGSTGKTSTKDMLAALLASRVRVLASPENLNTEIGLPLAILAARADTEVLVLEMAMRGRGQIAELVSIAAPEVGVIVNVGPVHLELLGSLEAIAAAKAELIAGLAPGAGLVIGASEPLLEPYLRDDLNTITFGPGGDVALADPLASEREVVITLGGGRSSPRGPGDARGSTGAPDRITLRPSFGQAYNITNLLAAVAAARALGITVGGSVEVSFSALRGERVELGDGVVVIDDCYNANPMSMRAAIDELVRTAPARRVAVLGDMLELGGESARFHREIGRHAAERGVELIVTVGALAEEMRTEFTGESRSVADAHAAAELLPSLLEPRDTVLVKGSRGVGLEVVAQALRATAPAGSSAAGDRPFSSLAAGPRRR